FWPASIVLHKGPLAIDDDRLVPLGELAALAFPLAFFHDFLPGAIEIGPVAKEQFIGLFAAGVLGRPAVEPLGALVPISEPVGKIDHADGILRLVEKSGLFGDFVLGQFADDPRR